LIPFDTFDEKTLQAHVGLVKDAKVRVYVLCCQNLAAVDSYVDTKSFLAGERALCSADPYISIRVCGGAQTSND
jgi:hypothetical protein